MVFLRENSDMFLFNKTKSFDGLKKFWFVFIFEKDFLWRGSHSQKIISCYMTQTKQTTRQQYIISFFISKVCIC